jgi:hypothetical protein
MSMMTRIPATVTLAVVVAAMVACGVAATVSTGPSGNSNNDSPAAFLFDIPALSELPPTTTPLEARRSVIELVSNAANAILQRQDVTSEPMTTCRRCAEKWMAMVTMHAGEFSGHVEKMRGDQLLGLVASVWQSCAKASIVDLVAHGASKKSLFAFANSAKRLHASLSKQQTLSTEAIVADLHDFGVALDKLAASVSEKSFVRRALADIIDPLVKAFTQSPQLAKALVREFQASKSAKASAPNVGSMPPVGFYQFIPALAGRALPTPFDSVSFSSRCYKSVSVSAEVKNETDREFKLTVTALDDQAKAGTLCIETLLFYAGASLKLDLVLWDQLFHEVKFKVKKGKSDMMSKAYWWDAKSRGIRVFYNTEPLMGTIQSAIETFILLVGPTVSFSGTLNQMTQMNAAMMLNAFTPIQPLFNPIYNNNLPTLTAAQFAASLTTGDVLAFTRLDAIDSFLNFLQSQNTAHVAVAVCPASTDNCLVCESRPEANFWLSANGVQCHDAAVWFTLANNVSYNVVHMPLSDTAKAFIDQNAAAVVATNLIGVDYGYSTWGFGWIDGPDSYPCFPTSSDPASLFNSTHCLSWDFGEMVLAFIDDVLPSFASYWLGEGLNNRLFAAKTGHPNGYGIIEAFYAADTDHGWSASDLLAIPEEDTWMYYSFRNGEVFNGTVYSSSAYVCSVLRAAGVFNNTGPNGLAPTFFCAESTPLEIVELGIYNASAITQVLGAYSFVPGPSMNTRPPYASMWNSCPSAVNASNNFVRPDEC